MIKPKIILWLFAVSGIAFSPTSGIAEEEIRGEIPLPVVASAPSPAATPAPAPVVPSEIESARRLKEEGKLGEAQKAYAKLFEKGNVSRKEKKILEKEYEEINRGLLLSHDSTEHSTVYTVVKGDSLYKIAKKHKTTVGLIKQMNGLQSDTIYPNMKLKVGTGKFSIKVDKSENRLWVFYQGKPIKNYSVATGTDNGTPTGTFKIINKLENPTWYHAGLVAPPGSEENILGTRWLGFDHPGYGIHGTTIPESIGKQATLGCVRMLNRDVEELYEWTPTETEVTVTD